MITLETITIRQIQVLRREAGIAADWGMAAMCNLALKGNQPALAECVEAIQAAEAMDDGEDD